MRFSKKALIATGTGAVVAMAIGGLALAYWTTDGSGTGSSTNASSNGSLVLTASWPAGVLAPGGPAQTVTYKATNASAGSLQVNTIHAVVSTSDALCLPADFTVPDATSGITVPAHTSTGIVVGTSSITFADTAADQNACKGATVTLTLSTV